MKSAVERFQLANRCDAAKSLPDPANRELLLETAKHWRTLGRTANIADHFSRGISAADAQMQEGGESGNTASKVSAGARACVEGDPERGRQETNRTEAAFHGRTGRVTPEATQRAANGRFFCRAARGMRDPRRRNGIAQRPLPSV